MSPERSQNVQDVFLNHIRKQKTPVTVFLLRRDGHTQLVYKHAISTVMPSVPIQLFEPEKETEDED